MSHDQPGARPRSVISSAGQIGSYRPSAGTTVVAGAAAALAGAALFNIYQARQAEKANPPLGRFIEVEGIRLHYLEAGQGLPVVLLHGNNTGIEDFVSSGLFDLVARSHRVIAFDRPGYGHSERPRDRLWTPDAQASLLRQAFSQLGIQRPVVVGHSWGTMVAMALALQDPIALRGLVLLSGYYFPTARLDVPIFAPAAVPLIGDVLRYTVSPLFGRLILRPAIKQMFAPHSIPPRFDAEFPKELMLRPSQIRATAEEAAFMVPAALAMRDQYRGLHLPMEIMAGDADRIIGHNDQSVALAQELSSSYLHVVPGAGHMVHHAVPEQVATAIERVSM